MNIKLLIADDHILFNDGIKQLLTDTFEIVAQVHDGKDVLAAVQQNSPDIILLDINLPSINGFEVAQSIGESFEKLKIIFLSMYSETEFVNQAKQLEVHGYMLKHSTKQELVECINQVMNGHTFFDSKLDKSIINLHQDDYFVKQFSLSEREVEIIKLIKDGNNSGKIAETLTLSELTIKTHRKNIYYKLGINKSTELIKFANEHGL